MAKTIIALGLCVVVAGTAGAYIGQRVGKAEAYHEFVGIADAEKRSHYALRYGFGLETFNGITGQDLWVLHAVHPDVKDGFFVDLGSADGHAISNTLALEQKGWRGVCIDPFPRNMQGRTCRVVEKAVASRSGREVEFQNPGSFSGGLLDNAGWWVSEEDKKNTVTVKTTTLADVLRSADAPEFIHYLNVDIEGAEYDALRRFPFDEYQFGAITIEHNDVQDRREQIRQLLADNGYRLQWAIRDQDWYQPADGNGGEGDRTRTSSSS